MFVEAPEDKPMDQKHALAALGALAQETRLELFRLLVTSGPQGYCGGTRDELLRAGL